jgi:antitoxin MazE
MKARIVRIGNSQGVRIPKPIIAAAGLAEDIEFRIVDSGLLIANARLPRAGWEEASARLHAAGEDRPMLPIADNDFDTAEWNWD